MQRTRVRIQPSATFIEQLITVNCLGKTKNKEKEAGNRPFKKKNSGYAEKLLNLPTLK